MNQLSNISCGGNSSELDSENIKVSGSGGLNVTNKLTPKKGKKMGVWGGIFWYSSCIVGFTQIYPLYFYKGKKKKDWRKKGKTDAGTICGNT